MIKGIKIIKVIKPFCMVLSSVGTIVLLRRFRLTLLNIFPSYVSAPRGHPSFYTLPSEAFSSSSTERVASVGTIAPLYRLKEGDRTQGTRKFVREISVRITGDILKPQYGFRQCYGTLKTVLQRNSKNSASYS